MSVSKFGAPARFRGYVTVLLVFLTLPEGALAARIGDLVEVGVWEQAVRFFSPGNGVVFWSLMGCILLGVSCGTMGGFVVVRKMALVGDVVSHAVLPGVVLGYLWAMEKNVVAMSVGAVLSGLFGTLVMRLIRQTTRLKQDAALGIVLGTFFAVGACLLAIVERGPSASKSGLDNFLFVGRASAITGGSVAFISVVTLVVILFSFWLYKELFSMSFDPGFARAIGLPVSVYHHIFMLLLTVVIVVAIQAVGVVLVSALLIIPASTAYLLVERFPSMIRLSAGLGALAALIGLFVSFLGVRLPSGPFIVLAATVFFGLTFLFAPRQGVFGRWLRRRRLKARIGRENTLKASFHILEAGGFTTREILLEDLAERRRNSGQAARAEIGDLVSRGLAELRGSTYSLTSTGWKRAGEVVRNHRLWELYLTNEANIAADHVHDDAEQIEHILGEQTVALLQEQLEHAEEDPHGKRIPVPGQQEVEGVIR